MQVKKSHIFLFFKAASGPSRSASGSCSCGEAAPERGAVREQFYFGSVQSANVQSRQAQPVHADSQFSKAEEASVQPAAAHRSET